MSTPPSRANSTSSLQSWDMVNAKDPSAKPVDNQDARLSGASMSASDGSAHDIQQEEARPSSFRTTSTVSSSRSSLQDHNIEVQGPAVATANKEARKGMFSGIFDKFTFPSFSFPKLSFLSFGSSKKQEPQGAIAAHQQGSSDSTYNDAITRKHAGTPDPSDAKFFEDRRANADTTKATRLAAATTAAASADKKLEAVMPKRHAIDKVLSLFDDPNTNAQDLEHALALLKEQAPEENAQKALDILKQLKGNKVAIKTAENALPNVGTSAAKKGGKFSILETLGLKKSQQAPEGPRKEWLDLQKKRTELMDKAFKALSPKKEPKAERTSPRLSSSEHHDVPATGEDPWKDWDYYGKEKHR